MRRPELGPVTALSAERAHKLARDRSLWTVLTSSIVTVGMAVTVTVLGLTPANGGMVGGTLVLIDGAAGQQLDPHVSGDLAAYTDENGGMPVIRFYDFLNPAVNVIPAGAPGDSDTLSSVDGTRIAFTRQHGDGSRACMVFDVVTSTATEIAPGSNLRVFGTAIGGDTVAFISLQDGGGSDNIRVGRISAPGAPLATLGNPAEVHTSPSVSPDGMAVVWERCAPGFTNCGILRSTYAGSWSAPAIVSDTGSLEQNPDTDGVYVVYDSERPASVGGPDIYFQLLAGGPETQLEIAGTQRNPSISQGVIAFESLAPAAVAADVFVYVIATNAVFQVTNTPTINETLNDLTVLPNGDVRVVWAANDDIFGENNIYARTFSLPSGDTTPPAVTIVSPADGATYLKGQTIAADFSCQDEAGGSGVASCIGRVAAGASLDTTTVGGASFTVIGTDNAGNSASAANAYNVVYGLTGFSQPVDNLPALNIATAGTALPVRFTLGGNQGLGIFAAGYPASSPVTCSATEPGSLIEETVTAGNSSLSYDSSSDQYSYVWKTDKSWKGTCRLLIVRLNDNTKHFARFRFR